MKKRISLNNLNSKEDNKNLLKLNIIKKSK